MRWKLAVWYIFVFFFSSRRRHTRFDCDWSSDVCSSDLRKLGQVGKLPDPQRPGLRQAKAEPAIRAREGLGLQVTERSRAGTLGADGTEIGRASCRERV